MKALRAGASVVTITPPLGAAIAGLFEQRTAETIADDLTARTLVLNDGTTHLALVVCDLICLTARTVKMVRSIVSERCGIPGDHVMISCTHTHTGPATADLLSSAPDPAYLEWLARRIADGVAVACSRLTPARLAYGAAKVDGVCFNRRYRMRDGTVVFNPPLDSPDIIEPVGPVDPEVTALLVEQTNGVPLALWANLSLHYVGTDDDLAISSDYFGHFARAVQQSLGEHSVGMLTNGTSGDVNNRDISQALGIASKDERARMVAMAVAAAAVQATLTQRRHDAPTLDVDCFPFSVTRRSITPDDVDLAKGLLSQPTASETEAASGFSFVVGQPIPSWQVRTYAGEVLHLAQMPSEISTEFQIMRIGELALFATPGEVFVELGLAIKAGSPFPWTAVVSLANDYIGYVPTKDAFRQGGYETWAARSAWPAPGTGETMVEAALTRLRDIQSRIPASAA